MLRFLSLGGLGLAVIGAVDNVKHIHRSLYVSILPYVRLPIDPSMYRCLSSKRAAGPAGSALQAGRPADTEAKVSLSQTNGRGRQVRLRAGKAAGGCGSEGFAESD